MTNPAGSRDLDALWDGFEPVGLSDVVATADMLIRKDRKYLVPLEHLPRAVDLCGAGGRVLTIGDRRSFRYRSTYFDTMGLDSYLDAAHRRPRRFKVRTRRYVETRTNVLEVKTRNRRGMTVKHRRPCGAHEEGALSADGRAFVETCLSDRSVPSPLLPTLTTGYRRSTLVLPGEEARITVDVDLTWENSDGRRLELGPSAVIETKTHGRPCAVDRALWALGHRPIVISKYCTGLAALHPQLPANKWNRTLRRHLDWQPRRHATHVVTDGHRKSEDSLAGSPVGRSDQGVRVWS